MDKVLNRDEIKARSDRILQKFWELKNKPPAEQIYWVIEQWVQTQMRLEKLEQKIDA
jgi:hypothetical protein